MNKAMKIVIVVALILIVGVVIAVKQNSSNTTSNPTSADVTVENDSQKMDTVKNTEVTIGLPKLVDLGAGKCIPCKLMAPILEELKTEYKGKFQVIVIDVWQNKNEASKYAITMIPTQIFYDASGKELYRHEGFYSKEDILGKWKELGIDLQNKGR